MSSTVGGTQPGFSGVGVYQTDFEWLPPTRANLAKLNAVIPPGFREVAPPAGHACK
ncbi:MAG: hypothetical protein ACM3ML_25820 [Micromonosporaceae bacterium]